MGLTRRTLAALAGAAFLPAPAVLAQRAGNFPNRPIRLVVAFAAGGNSDTLARLLQPRLAAFLGQPVVVENRGGAGGALAAGQVAAAPADGHTLLFDSASFVVAQFINRSIPFDYERDFAPVGMVAEAPYVIGASAASGIRTLGGYLDAARGRQDGLPYGTPGVGSVGHLAGVVLAHRAGVKLEHVPYRGGAEAARDLAAGTLASAMITASSLRPVIESGRAVAIAVTSARRGGLPDVPTVAEGGYPGYDVTSWNALLCRSGTPDAVRQVLAEAIDATTADAELKRRFADMGAEATPAEPEKLGERLQRERQIIRDLIRDTGISLG
jgi:tripartite-type tricarboxylate transporter receptor subunit TctC